MFLRFLLFALMGVGIFGFTAVAWIASHPVNDAVAATTPLVPATKLKVVTIARPVRGGRASPQPAFFAASSSAALRRGVLPNIASRKSRRERSPPTISDAESPRSSVTTVRSSVSRMRPRPSADRYRSSGRYG